MSTPTSETAQTGGTPASEGSPFCWLTSGEEVFWSEPRACHRLGVAAGPDPERSLLVLRLDPPAIGQSFGLGAEDIDTIVVTPVSRAASLNPPFPVDVHVLLPREPWASAGAFFASDDLQLVARAKLVGSREEAQTQDRAMQRMNGPRR